MAALTTSRNPASGAHGFTLVEMVVAMMISMIALAVLSKVLIDSVHGSSKSLNVRQAQAQASTALELFGRDIRQAESPDRTARVAGSTDQLRLMLLKNDVPSNLHPWDITIASSTQLWFVSDVVPTALNGPPEPECVGWHLTTSAPWKLLRTVRTPGHNSWKNCSSAGSSSTQTMLTFATAAGNETSRPSNLFTYDRSVNSRRNLSPLDPDDCSPSFVNQPAGAGYGWLERNSIKAVHVNLGAAVDDVDVAQNKLLLTADIETRLSHDYTYAMGCSF